MPVDLFENENTNGSAYVMIWISPKAKAYLDGLKIIPREPYYSVMDRILFETDSPIKD